MERYDCFFEGLVERYDYLFEGLVERYDCPFEGLVERYDCPFEWLVERYDSLIGRGAGGARTALRLMQRSRNCVPAHSG